MNNIYKVIWSKAKNCYVVASEIARSHTKSATGSEKIGGVTRRSLLASLMALSLLCGGLGVASAANGTVHVAESSASSDPAVYTTDKVNILLDGKADKTALDSKANETEVVKNTENIATNKANITALQSELGNKADKSTVTTALEGKANKADVYSKTEADDRYATKDALDNKADQTYVDTEVGKKANKATTLAGYEITDAYTKEKTDELLNTKANAADVYTRGDIDTKLADVYSKTEVDGKITGEENARNIAIQTAINGEAENRKNAIDAAIAKEVADRNQAIKIEVDKEANARDTAIANAKNDLQTKITEEKTAREAAIDELKKKDTALEGNINTLDASSVKYDNATVKDKITLGLGGAGGTTITNLKDADLSDSSTDAVTGKQLNKTNEDLKTEAQKRADMDTLLSNRADALEKNTGGITRSDAKDETYIEKNVTVDSLGNVTAQGKLKGEGVDAGAVNAGSLNVENATNLKGAVTMDNKLSVTGDTSLGKTDVGGALNVTGESSLKNTTVGGTLGVTGATTLSGELTAKENATFEKNVTVGKDLTVDGKLNVDKISMKNDELKNGKKHDSATTITADEISNLAKVTEQGNTTESQFTHNEKGTFNYAKDEKSTGEWKRATSNVTADGVSNKMTDSDGNTHTYYQTATETREQLVNGDKSNFEKKTAEGNTISIKDKDAAGNDKSLTNKQTVDGEKTSVTNKDSSSTINQGADQIRYNVTSKDENTTSSSIEVKADGITNTSKDGTIINDAKDIENNATGDITNTAQNGSIINKADNGNISNTATNVTNEGTESVTNKVGANEVKVSTDGVDIKAADGKKITESVGTASRVVENGKITDNAGDSTVITNNGQGTTFGKNGSKGTTNIYGDSIKTGTINANDTTTDKLTAGAAAGADGGRLTVDADGVKGSYKSGDYTSRSYILANTLKSGVDNGTGTDDNYTIGSRTDHSITDDGQAKLDETVKDANGSNVTNKTSTGTVTTITDGTTTTTTEQGVKDITNTATGGTITNTAKDIVNNAQDTITNTAGTKITDTAGDSSVVTENGKGTTFTKTGSTAYSTAAGAPTDTNIAGNHITTGRVDANELGVSDKDGDNTADFSVKAGEGVKASAGDGKTTGSLDVTAGEVGSSVKDASGKGSTFKQRIDAIMGNVKTDAGESDVTQKGDEITSKVGIGEATNSKVTQKKDLLETAVTDGTNYNISDDTASASAKLLTDGTKVNKQQDNLDSSVKTITNGTYTTSTVQSALDITHTAKDGTITNDAKDIVNNASNSITDKVGDNTRVTTSTSITDTVGTANRKIEDGKITDTAGDSTVTTVHGKGTTFTKKGSTAYREGGPTDTNISGNTITTGKVTMDYANVMKDLGVRGNANINGKTTTGSLEVTGTSTLKGDVTMENNATVGNNLTVNGTTKTKTLNVTENAEVGGELKVAKKATFEDSVSIAKDLTVGGDVTAKSYKVGDKTYISADGINANDQKITNVADGSISEGSKDAVNGGQLYQVKNDLEGKVNKVGANAAAMANLHPMEFDPDSKWNIAAAMGNYGSETATAIGAFYRPNEDVMVNFSTAFGTGENMVGGGVSVRLGKGSNKLSRQESNALKAQVNDLTARMDALLSVLNPNMSKDFPDVPENHWAYEAVSRLAGNDIVQGYPDGEFHGDRTMTRYEMAEIIYNALSRGAEAEKELVEEFKPELQAMAASEKATAERAEG